MEAVKRVLISGASMAGLSAAWWMNKSGYRVTIVEMANAPRTNGAAVDIKGRTVATTKRMGIFELLKMHRLTVETIAFKNADDTTAGSILLHHEGAEHSNDDIEIERDMFVSTLVSVLKDHVEFVFNNSITGLEETKDDIKVRFKNGDQRSFHLVLGCDGLHSAVRRLCFGPESNYAHFLKAYFSISIVPELLVPEKSMQMYNVPDKAIMLNAYHGKTDIIFCFFADDEIPYDYRDTEQQRKIIEAQFAGQRWRTTELLEAIHQSENFYFDKFCQIKMPSWTKGRVALVGDAAYAASPAAGMGASLAIEGAAALADALEKHNHNFELAFVDYHQSLRPFVEQVQAFAAANISNNFILRTEEAISKRNALGAAF